MEHNKKYMDTSKLFKNQVTELETLSNKPTVFWYVSAGDEFRGPVFLTQHHIDHLSRYNGREFIKPDLFVYNCLGEEVKDLRKKLSQGRVDLSVDDITKIEGVNYQSLSIRDDLGFHIDQEYINLAPDSGSEAFYFELIITGEEYTETQRVLYFEHENIDFFNKIILKNYFNVKYLCATTEGIYGGRCMISIAQHIYKDTQPLFFTDIGFKPNYFIGAGGTTTGAFESGTKNSEIVSVTKDYGDYIWKKSNKDPKESWKDAIIYKLDYIN